MIALLLRVVARCAGKINQRGPRARRFVCPVPSRYRVVERIVGEGGAKTTPAERSVRPREGVTVCVLCVYRFLVCGSCVFYLCLVCCELGLF